MPFSALGLSTGSWDGLWLQDSSGGNQATLYVDDIRLLARAARTLSSVIDSMRNACRSLTEDL